MKEIKSFVKYLAIAIFVFNMITIVNSLRMLIFTAGGRHVWIYIAQLIIAV